MALAYRSVAVQAWGTANPHAAQKPSGLTAGDLMVMLVSSYYGVPSGDPDGWTLVHDSGSLANIYTHTYTKVATADDVAASSFSVPNANSRNICSGVYALSGASSTLGFVGSVGSTGYLRQFSVSGGPSAGIAVWKVISDAGYTDTLTLNATTENYNSAPYGRTASGGDWNNADYLPTVMKHGTWSSGTITLAGHRTGYSTSGCAATVLMVVEASEPASTVPVHLLHSQIIARGVRING